MKCALINIDYVSHIEVLHVFQVYKLDIILIASSAIICIYIYIYMYLPVAHRSRNTWDG